MDDWKNTHISSVRTLRTQAKKGASGNSAKASGPAVDRPCAYPLRHPRLAATPERPPRERRVRQRSPEPDPEQMPLGTLNELERERQLRIAFVRRQLASAGVFEAAAALTATADAERRPPRQSSSSSSSSSSASSDSSSDSSDGSSDSDADSDAAHDKEGPREREDATAEAGAAGKGLAPRPPLPSSTNLGELFARPRLRCSRVIHRVLSSRVARIPLARSAVGRKAFVLSLEHLIIASGSIFSVEEEDDGTITAYDVAVRGAPRPFGIPTPYTAPHIVACTSRLACLVISDE